MTKHVGTAKHKGNAKDVQSSRSLAMLYQEVANLLFKVLTRQILYPKCSRMHHVASFCVPPTAFSLSRVGMYAVIQMSDPFIVLNATFMF